MYPLFTSLPGTNSFCKSTNSVYKINCEFYKITGGLLKPLKLSRNPILFPSVLIEIGGPS